MTTMIDTTPALLPDDDAWRPLAPQARWPIYVGWVIGALSIVVPTAIGVFVLMGANDFDTAARIAAVLTWSAAWLLWFALLGHWSWKHCLWRLDDSGLRLRRGRFWRKEILIPRTRVQHLDLERGPLERKLGLSTLVVHTAGTRFHALRQSGFRSEEAQALRDALIPSARIADDII